MELQVFTDTELADLERIQKNLTAKIPHILESIGAHIASSVDQNFQEGGRPLSWQPLAPATLKKKKGTKILIESGLLRDGIISWVEGNTLFIGPTGPATIYARIQDQGGETGIHHRTIIPARPYLLLQQEDQEYIHNFIRQEILEK